MRYIILFLVVLFFIVPVQAQTTLQGGVQESWTIDTARQEAFRGAQFFRNLSNISPRDPFFLENKTAILKASSSVIKVKNYTITIFYTYQSKKYLGYAVSPDNSNMGYYYDKNGKLYAVEYENGGTYPKKAYRYEYPKGKLITISMDVSSNDSYVFSPKGDLISHCLNEKCYSANGTPVILRENPY